MKYISVPIKMVSCGDTLSLSRPYEDNVAMMDNLVEIIALTPKGSFNADPDFGFEYWDPSHTDVSAMQFNSLGGHDHYAGIGMKERCEASIAECILNYAPARLNVSDVYVEIIIHNDKVKLTGRKKAVSHREVALTVSAKIDDGLGTMRDYSRVVTFMMEPVVRRTVI